MKKIPSLILLALVSFSCSAPKYTYYFDRVKQPLPKSMTVTPLAPVNPEQLVASTETKPYEVLTPVVKDEKQERAVKRNEGSARKRLVEKLEETRTLLKKDD